MMNDSLPNFRLDDQIILITGATGHLGSRIAKGVALMGGIPIICGRNRTRLKKLANEIRRHGGQVYELFSDFEQKESSQLVMKEIKGNFNALDGIVNCAHSGRPGDVESSEITDFEIAQKIHINTPFFLVKEGLELLKRAASKKRGGASIVNISSMYGCVSPDPKIYEASGLNNPPYYGAAKAGLIQLSRYLSCHLGQHNIRVNSICPGAFPPEEIKGKNPAFYSHLVAKNPLGRIGKASEITGPVVFLLSEASSYITGANLVVDGGWTAW